MWLGRKVREPPEPSAAPPPPPPSFFGEKPSRNRRKGGANPTGKLSASPAGGHSGSRSSESLGSTTPLWQKHRVPSASPTSTSASSPRGSSQQQSVGSAGHSLGGNLVGGTGLSASASSSSAFLSGISIDPRWAPEYPPQMFPPPGVRAGLSAGAGGIAGEARMANGDISTIFVARHMDASGAPGSILTANRAADPDLLDKALTAQNVDGPRPGSGRWPGVVLDGAGGGAGGAARGRSDVSQLARTSPLLASSGSWAEAPDDLALTKKFRISLMFYTKVIILVWTIAHIELPAWARTCVVGLG